MKTAYLHESILNVSEGRLRLTIGPKRNSTLISAEMYWRDSASSRESALAILRWRCEQYGYVLSEVEWDTIPHTE